jgi:hypothetical protein
VTKKKVVKKEGTPEERGPLVIETFTPMELYTVNQLRQDKPSCWEGNVRVRRYRITVEKIEEPLEVIGQRIQDLWDACDNHHHVGPLRAAAKGIGLELKGTYGTKRKK